MCDLRDGGRQAAAHPYAFATSKIERLFLDGARPLACGPRRMSLRAALHPRYAYASALGRWRQAPRRPALLRAARAPRCVEAYKRRCPPARCAQVTARCPCPRVPLPLPLPPPSFSSPQPAIRTEHEVPPAATRPPALTHPRLLSYLRHRDLLA
jgi:hypothetical protein